MSEMKNVAEMTRKEFDELKHRHWDEDVECDSIIILPGRSKDLHDSGFRCMDFVAVEDNKPICLLTGGSDVIHIDGIGGLGDDWLNKNNRVPEFVIPTGWSIDCLPKSGLLRMWPNSRKMKCGSALSSFEIFAIMKDKEDVN